MPDLSKRATTPELMDDLESSGGDLHRALHELDGINYVLGGNYVTLKGLELLLKEVRSTPDLHIADLGCGSGDILKRIRKQMEKRNTNAVLTGFDANPNVITHANLHTPPSCRIQYETVNIFSDDFKSRKFDVITATLFFHHFTDYQLISFFRQLKTQVSTGMVINDIHRHWFAYWSIKILTRFLSRSPMVKHDAPVSVSRAFKKKELHEILRAAGFTNYKIKWCWAFRWQIVVWF